MHETPTTDRGPSTDDCWRSVYIASPRRLEGRTYAMILRRDGVEDTIARAVTIAQALVIALEHRTGYGAVMSLPRPGLSSRIRHRPSFAGRERLEPVLRGVVRTARLASDHVRALEFF
jgi:hypothetical protein